MAEYTVKMRCVYDETWSVEAASADEARKLCEDLDESVAIDEQGVCVDCEVVSVKAES